MDHDITLITTLAAGFGLALVFGVPGGTAAANPEGHPLWRTIAQTPRQAGAFVAILLAASRRVLPWPLRQAAPGTLFRGDEALAGGMAGQVRARFDQPAPGMEAAA
jgi:predicted Kef-type K+ transport protein